MKTKATLLLLEYLMKTFSSVINRDAIITNIFVQLNSKYFNI